MPLSKAIADSFRSAHPEAKVSVEVSGTGGGFKKFCEGKVDLTGASRPINAEEVHACEKTGVEYMELPVAFDSLSVVVHAKNDFVDCLTVDELKTLWGPAADGKITQWNQVRGSFPAQPIKLFGPGKDSGTFDYFTLAISGTEGASRTDYTASEDDEVIERGVASTPTAIGYFAFAYYAAHKDQLKLVAVDSGRGCIAPSAQTVADGSYAPLARPLFIYVSRAAAERPEVQALARAFVSTANEKLVRDVGYVPLSPSALSIQARRFENKTLGSAMGGHGSVLGVSFNLFDDDDPDRIRALLVQ